jgi:hypothetical protein
MCTECAEIRLVPEAGAALERRRRDLSALATASRE